jgi:hypothetical protein
VELPAQYAPPAAPYAGTRRIRVVGPHFGLAPGDIGPCYPPADSEGHYALSLPSITLLDSSLPWQISLGGAPSEEPAPWLALLLLLPEEIRPNPAVGTASTDGSFVVGLADYLAPPAEVQGPKFTEAQRAAFLRQYEKLSLQVIDVDAAAFTAIAPQFTELHFLAHARETNPEHQEIAALHTPGRVSAVLGNRLPTGSPSGLYLAHLVSLEGFADILPGSGLPSKKIVRLASLARWTFRSTEGAGENFVALMAGLDAGTLTLAPAEPATPGPEETVAAAMAHGYCALHYATRLGEASTGWYRGPCLPVPMRRNKQPPFGAAEAGLIYDWKAASAASNGLFDLSFAVAWQTGRLAALADRQFVTALLTWVRGNMAAAQFLAERGATGPRPGLLAADAAPAQRLAPDLARTQGLRFLAEHLAPLLSSSPTPGTPQPLLGPPRLREKKRRP